VAGIYTRFVEVLQFTNSLWLFTNMFCKRPFNKGIFVEIKPKKLKLCKMKKLFLITLVAVFAITKTNAQLTDWQKQHAGKVVFFDTWLQSRLDETDADASQEIELGNDFWFRAYFDDKNAPKRDNKLELRISAEGVAVTLNDMYLHAKDNFATAKGILPYYDQIQLPGIDNFWKNKNIFSCCGFAPTGKFDEFNNYGCQNNGYYAESLLRYLLAKIDNKVIPGASLSVKFELVLRTSGEYRGPGGTYEPIADGTLKLKVPAKEKALKSDLYRFVEVPGMSDKSLEENIKKGILTLAQADVSEVLKVQVLSNSYNIEKNNYGVALDRWLQTRVVYKSKATGEEFTSLVNVVFNYDGSNYDPNVSKVYFQCGNTFVPTFGIK